jgi:magnesium transporter
MARVTLIGYDSKEYEEKFEPKIEEALACCERYPVVWLDIVRPEKDEMQKLETVFGLDPLALEDIVNGNQRPKVEDYGEVTFTVLRIPKDLGVERSEQVNMFITKQMVITIHSGELDLDKDIKSMIYTHHAWLVRGKSDRLAYTVIDKAVDSYFPVIDRLAERLEKIEAEVIESSDKLTIRKIHDTRWELILLRRVLNHLSDMIQVMIRGSAPNISKDVRAHLRDVHDHILRHLDHIDAFREMLNSLTEIYVSNISLRINRIITILTAVSLIFLPLTLIASIYGMNFRFLPEIYWEWGYPFALVLMLVVGILTYYLLKKKGWFYVE